MSTLYVDSIEPKTTGGNVNFNETPTFASGADPFNSVIETWYYDNTITVHNNTDLLYRGYTRLTTNNTANKNGGMTHASPAGTNGTGIWTFPSTGIWRVELSSNFYLTAGADLSVGIYMEVTTDNNTYNSVHSGRSSGHATNAYVNITVPYVLNVNDVSNVKFRHKLTSNTGIAIRGNTSVWGTKMNFIKLCPSV